MALERRGRHRGVACRRTPAALAMLLLCYCCTVYREHATPLHVYLVHDTAVMGFGRIREVTTLLVLEESSHDIAPNETEHSNRYAPSYRLISKYEWRSMRGSPASSRAQSPNDKIMMCVGQRRKSSTISTWCLCILASSRSILFVPV